jgi:hypothetical protein
MSSAPDTRRRPHRVYWHPARDDLGNEKSVFKGGNCGPRGSRWVPKGVAAGRAYRLVSGMPPRRRNSKDTPPQLAARMRSWRVSLLRGRAQPLGTVEAPDEPPPKADKDR